MHSALPVTWGFGGYFLRPDDTPVASMSEGEWTVNNLTQFPDQSIESRINRSLETTVQQIPEI